MTAPATLADLLARTDPNHPALILPEGGAVTTHRGLAAQVEALAGQLRRTDLQPGQPVAIVLPNGLEYLATFLAVARARLIAAPLNPAYRADEFRFYL
ncbi:MAG: AMP-binding protein, partial [Gemmataceae bacterium]|nr:AMP-binding protein [Gemmataceae bacterium]